MKRFMKIFSICMAVVVLGCCFVFGASANEVATTSAADMDADTAINAARGLFNQITETLNFANVAKVLGIGLAAVLGIWLAWWGLRKLFSMLRGVLERHTIRLG